MTATAQEITKSPYITLLGKEYAIGDWKPFINGLANDTTFHVWELSRDEVTAIYNNRNLRKKSYKMLWIYHMGYLSKNVRKGDESIKAWYVANRENLVNGYKNSPLEDVIKRDFDKTINSIDYYISK